MSLALPGGRLGDLLRVPIDYVLEVQINGETKGSITLPNTPSDIRLARPGSTDFAFTLNDAVTRWNELRAGRIVLSGRSGLRARSGQDQTGGLIFQPGPVILREFDAFLKNMHSGLKLNQEAGNEVACVFRAYNEQVHLKVHVEEWVWSRASGTSRFSYEWQLALMAYAEAPPVVPTNILAPLDEWANEAAGVIDQANAYGAAISNGLTNLRRDLDALRAPLLALERTATVAQDITEGIRRVAEFPRDCMADLNRAAAKLGQAMQDALDTWDFVAGGAGTTEQWLQFKSIVGLADENEAASAEVVGGLGTKTEELAILGADIDFATVARRVVRRVSPPGQRAEPLRPGEDLRDLAARTLGQRERWTEVAWLNGWQGPATRNDGSQPIVGEPLFVPSDSQDFGPQQAYDPMGIDLYLDPEGLDLEVLGTDLRLSRGDANAEQALRTRLTLSQGDWVLWPAYGLPVSIGEGLTAARAAYLAALVREQLVADYRVEDVRDLVVEVEGTTVTIRATVNLSDGRAMPLIAPVPLAG
jgi:hypothetical protein